jgi:hypothetical protein
VTQLEWIWEKGQGLTYYDASNVAGQPFVNNGFVVCANDPKDPGQKKNHCTNLTCAPWDVACNEAYEGWNDDEQAMRACFDDVILGMQLCTDN